MTPHLVAGTVYQSIECMALVKQKVSPLKGDFQNRRAAGCSGSPGKTGVTADRDKIEFRLFNSSSIFNITLREELFSLPKQN